MGKERQTDWELTRLTTPYLHNPHEAYWDKNKEKDMKVEMENNWE